MKSSHKLDFESLKKENCELKNYMKNLTYENAIMKFRLKAKFFPSIRNHFKNDPKFEKELWFCPEGCKKIGSISHVTHCNMYSDLRRNLSLDDDEDLVQYFLSVLERRKKKEEEESEP